MSVAYIHGMNLYDNLLYFVAYFCPLCARDFSIRYIYMRDKYVYMQNNYVNMQLNNIDMQANPHQNYSQS